MPIGTEGASPAASNDDLPNAAAAPAVDVPAVEPDANAAASSPADEKDANKEPASLLDVVKNAVEPPAAKAPEASSTAEGDQVQPDAEAAAKAEKAKAEGDDSDVPFHEHPRWKKVIAENNDLKADAERARNIDNFLTSGGVTAETAAEVLEVTVLARSGDPTKIRQARDYVQGQLDALNGMLGVELPDDLLDRVDSGDLDEATARELAEGRATSRLHAEQEKRRTERDTTARAAEEATNISTRMATAVQGWENETKKSDPDYAKKEALIQSTAVAIMHREGAPKTEAEALALTQRAYREVDAAMKAALPKPKPVDTVTPSGSSAVATAAPTSLREAINASLAA